LKTLEDGAVGFVSLVRRLGRFAAGEVSDDVGVDTHGRHPENGLSLTLCLSLHISSVGNATSAPATVIASRVDVRGMRIGARWGG
jgi:hypothetical protein